MNTSSRIWLKIYLKIMTFIFKHPKYYTELRKRNKSDQAISYEHSTESEGVRPGPGHKQRDSQVVNQVKLSSQSQDSSSKQQATSVKLQAPSSDKKL